MSIKLFTIQVIQRFGMKIFKNKNKRNQDKNRDDLCSTSREWIELEEELKDERLGLIAFFDAS